MKTSQKGFIVPLLLIIAAILLAGGGAYFYTQTMSENPPPTGDVTLPQATSTETSSSKTFAVPGSFTLILGKTIKQVSAVNPVSITLKEISYAGDVRVTPLPLVVLSNGIAPDQTVSIDINSSYLYQGLSFTLTNSSANSATFSVTTTNKSPAVTIDAASLLSSSSPPTITGTATNLDQIVVYVGKGASAVAADGNIFGYVSIVNGRWSATFSTKNFTNGKYSITVKHPSNQTVLATGTVIITVN